MDCIKNTTFHKLRVSFNNVEFSVSHGDAAPVQCTLILELITLKQQLEDLHMDIYNG